MERTRKVTLSVAQKRKCRNGPFQFGGSIWLRAGVLVLFVVLETDLLQHRRFIDALLLQLPELKSSAKTLQKRFSKISARSYNTPKFSQSSALC